MNKSPPYAFLLSDEALAVWMGLPKRRQRRLYEICQRLAAFPATAPDYVLDDSEGRKLRHIRTEGMIITYWLDDPARQVLIIELRDLANGRRT